LLAQEADSAMATETGALQLTPPTTIKVASAIFIVLALLQFVVPALWVVHRSDIWNAVAALNPSLPAETSRGIVDGTIFGSVGLHTLIAILYVWLAILTRRGYRHARMAATVLLVLDMLGGWLSFHASSNLLSSRLPYVIGAEAISLGLQIGALWALWGPASSSSYLRGARNR
jgi:hypothetical protein